MNPCFLLRWLYSTVPALPYVTWIKIAVVSSHFLGWLCCAVPIPSLENPQWQNLGWHFLSSFPCSPPLPYENSLGSSLKPRHIHVSVHIQMPTRALVWLNFHCGWWKFGWGSQWTLENDSVIPEQTRAVRDSLLKLRCWLVVSRCSSRKDDFLQVFCPTCQPCLYVSGQLSATCHGCSAGLSFRARYSL